MNPRKISQLDAPLDLRRWTFPELLIEVSVFRNYAGRITSQTVVILTNGKEYPGLRLGCRSIVMLSYSDWNQLEPINNTVPLELQERVRSYLGIIQKDVAEYIALRIAEDASQA